MSNLTTRNSIASYPLPLSSHLALDILSVSATLESKQWGKKWQGHLVFFLSKSIIFAWIIPVAHLACIEFIAATALSVYGAIFNSVIYNNQSQLLKDWTVKAIQYGTSSLLFAVCLMAGLKNASAEYTHAYRLKSSLSNPNAIGIRDLLENPSISSYRWIKYQNQLANYFKTSLLEIHQSDELSSYLSRDGRSGKEVLESVDGSAFMPLATYTQYKELLDPITCPPIFSSDLARYHSRREGLIKAKKLVEALNSEQKKELVRKILQGADFKATEAVQSVYLEVAKLAAPITQGTLMKTKAFSSQEQDLLQLAYQSGLTQIMH